MKMILKLFLVAAGTFTAQGVILSNYLIRNPLYDNRATMESNVISTVNSKSRPGCAAHCTTNPTCKSLLYNTISRYCQLLSVQMSPVSDNGPQTSTGWRYYERKFGKLIYISLSLSLSLKILFLNSFLVFAEYKTIVLTSVK